MRADLRTAVIRSAVLKMEPLAGLEPATYSLQVSCSTTELQRLAVD